MHILLYVAIDTQCYKLHDKPFARVPYAFLVRCVNLDHARARLGFVGHREILGTGFPGEICKLRLYVGYPNG